MLIVSIYDKKAGEYLNVTLEKTEVIAGRNFENAIKNAHESSLLHSHKDDFCLYHVGNYNLATGDIENVNSTVIIDGSSIVVER